MQFTLVTPERLVADLQATYVAVCGTEGDFGVLDGHQPFLSAVRAGTVTVTTEEGEQSYTVSEGFADVGPDHVTVLVEKAAKV